MSHLGVDRVREIDRRGTRRELFDLALGREDEDFALKKVHPKEFHELLRLARILLPIEHLAEPRQGLIDFVRLTLRLRFGDPLLVAPMRRDSIFRSPVHLMASDLDLVSAPLRSDDRRVERLIHIGLGGRDEVVKSLLNRCPFVVNDAQRGVTVLHVIGQHTHGHQVVDFFVG